MPIPRFLVLYIVAQWFHVLGFHFSLFLTFFVYIRKHQISFLSMRKLNIPTLLKGVLIPLWVFGTIYKINNFVWIVDCLFCLIQLHDSLDISTVIGEYFNTLLYQEIRKYGVSSFCLVQIAFTVWDLLECEVNCFPFC